MAKNYEASAIPAHLARSTRPPMRHSPEQTRGRRGSKVEMSSPRRWSRMGSNSRQTLASRTMDWYDKKPAMDPRTTARLILSSGGRPC